MLLLTNFQTSEILKGSSEALKPSKFISALIKSINAVNSSKSNQPPSNRDLGLNKEEIQGVRLVSRNQAHFFNFEIGDIQQSQKGSINMSQKQSSRSGKEYMQSQVDDKLNADDFSMFFNIRVMCSLIESTNFSIFKKLDLTRPGRLLIH